MRKVLYVEPEPSTPGRHDFPEDDFRSNGVKDSYSFPPLPKEQALSCGSIRNIPAEAGVKKGEREALRSS